MKLFNDVINKLAHNCVEQSCLITTPKSIDAQVPPAVQDQASVLVYIADRASRPSVQYREVSTQPSHQEKHVEF